MQVGYETEQQRFLRQWFSLQIERDFVLFPREEYEDLIDERRKVRGAGLGPVKRGPNGEPIDTEAAIRSEVEKLIGSEGSDLSELSANDDDDVPLVAAAATAATDNVPDKKVAKSGEKRGRGGRKQGSKAASVASTTLPSGVSEVSETLPSADLNPPTTQATQGRTKKRVSDSKPSRTSRAQSVTHTTGPEIAVEPISISTAVAAAQPSSLRTSLRSRQSSRDVSPISPSNRLMNLAEREPSPTRSTSSRAGKPDLLIAPALDAPSRLTRSQQKSQNPSPVDETNTRRSSRRYGPK